MSDTNFKQLEQLLDKRFEASERKIQENMQETVRQEILASEDRLKRAIKEEGGAVRNEIGNFIQENIIPELEKKADKSDIDRLDRKIDQVLDQNAAIKKEIRTIKSLPTIASELAALKP